MKNALTFCAFCSTPDQRPLLRLRPTVDVAKLIFRAVSPESSAREPLLQIQIRPGERGRLSPPLIFRDVHANVNNPNGKDREVARMAEARRQLRISLPRAPTTKARESGVNALSRLHPYRDVFHGRTVTKAERRVKAGEGAGTCLRLLIVPIIPSKPVFFSFLTVRE